MTYTMEEKNSKRDISHPCPSELHLTDVDFVENYVQLGFFSAPLVVSLRVGISMSACKDCVFLVSEAGLERAAMI